MFRSKSVHQCKEMDSLNDDVEEVEEGVCAGGGWRRRM